MQHQEQSATAGLTLVTVENMSDVIQDDEMLLKAAKAITDGATVYANGSAIRIDAPRQPAE